MDRPDASIASAAELHSTGLAPRSANCNDAAVVIITGFLDFPDVDRDELLAGISRVTELSRRDAGCIEYWWAEDTRRPARFRFFECWETQQHLDDHRAQPFEAEFLEQFVTRCSGADANFYQASDRRSAG